MRGLACEYSAGLAVVGILIWFVLSDLRRGLCVGVGMVPPLMLIPLYHWICFGDPFTFAYLNEASFTQMHEGFFGIKFPPKAEHAFMLLLSAERGLFFWSPFLLLSFVGYSRLWKNSRLLFSITYLFPLLHVLAISAYFYPSGGGMLGPRLLAPILPLLSLPIAIGLSRFPRIGCALAVVSILITTLATVVGIVGVHGPNPLFEIHLPDFLQERFSHNLGLALGLPGHVSLLPLLFGLTLGIWLTWRHLPRICSPGPRTSPSGMRHFAKC